MFAKLCKTTFEKCDLKSCLEALRKSSDTSSGGSGQARKVYRFTECTTANVRLSPLLRLDPGRRSHRSLFVNALTGCDFITPFKHSNKPKCVICGEERCDWKHLIFQCPKRPNCAQHFVDAMTSRLFALTSDENPCVSAAATHSMIFLQRLWVDKNFDAILEFAFGICCFENGKPSPLRYRKVLVPIIEVTAREIGRVHNSWLDAAATQQ